MLNKKNHLHLVSPTKGSIGEITEDLYKFFKSEFFVTRDWKDEIAEKREILLCHFLNEDVVASIDFETFKYKILIQPIDGTVLRKQVVLLLNQFDLIITPANAGKVIMQENGVRTHIEIIPNFFKEDMFYSGTDQNLEKFIPENKIVFYHESSFHPRKGIDILYESFIKAFSDTEYADKIVLVLKDLPFNSVTFLQNERYKKQAIKLQKKYKKTPDIIKFSCLLDERELKYLWSRTDIYVSCAKIEGFGIPLLRMLLLKKPIIALKNNLSGYSDYLNEENSYLVSTEKVIAHDEFMWLYQYESEWSVPKTEDVVEALKTCLDDYLNLKAKEDKNLSSLIDNYFYIPVMKKYVNCINENFSKSSN